MAESGDEESSGINEQTTSNGSVRQRKRGSVVDPNLTGAVGDELNNNYKSEPKTHSNEAEATSKSIEMQRDEYTQSLNQWLQQCHHWNYFRLMNQMLFLTSNPGFSVNIPQRPNVTPQNAARRPAGQIYIIPKLWKRAVAELIDFVFLLLVKVMVTYLVLDYLDFIDQNKYEFSLSDEEFDAYHLAYEWSSEIIIIEIIHRLIVVVFETICLCRRRNHNSRPGGATPGKMILGLKVVSCSQINELPNGTIQILPAEDIGVWRSLLRALIKNVSSVFFLPSSLTVFISNHNRAAYDFAAKSIVVEEIRIANANNVHQRVN